MKRSMQGVLVGTWERPLVNISSDMLRDCYQGNDQSERDLKGL